MEQRVFVGETRCAYVIFTESLRDTHGTYGENSVPTDPTKGVYIFFKNAEADPKFQVPGG